MASYGPIRALFGDDGIVVGIAATMGDEEFVADDPCDENGDDWDDWENSNPPAFKLVETSYKGRQDGTLVATIVMLGDHPLAERQSFVDDDGDFVWRAIFRLSDCPNFKK